MICEFLSTRDSPQTTIFIMNCKNRISIFVMSLVAYGSAIFLIAYLLSGMETDNVATTDHNFWLLAIMVECIFAVGLIYSVYASFHGGRVSSRILFIVVVITQIVMLLCIVYLFQNVDVFERASYIHWKNNGGTDEVSIVQTTNKCCGYYNSTDHPSHNCNRMLPGCRNYFLKKGEERLIASISVFGVDIIVLTVIDAMAFLAQKENHRKYDL